MVNLETAEKALKTVYLGVVQDQLNSGINPFMSKIEQTTSDIWGKEIVKMVKYGMNGGIGAGSEDGILPTPSGNNYKQFRLELKNLYGTIEISDKAIMASQNSAGAFVNLLNAEMDSLLNASKLNLGRMLYGDGSGKLSEVADINTDNVITVDNIHTLSEGMLVDFYSKETGKIYTKMKGRKIKSIDRVNRKVTLEGAEFDTLAVGDYLTIQNSKDYEICGLGAIFSDKDLYGLKRSENEWMKPYEYMLDINNMNNDMRTAMDYTEEYCGSKVNMILTSYKLRKAFSQYTESMRINQDYMEVDGGFKAVSFCGVPVVADRFISEKDMYLVNTDDFKLHQLADWRWLEGDGGKVIKQKPGTPCYSATLVKYANLICDRPMAQCKLVETYRV